MRSVRGLTWFVWSALFVFIAVSAVLHAQAPPQTATAVMTGNATTAGEAASEWTGSVLLGFYVPRILQWLKNSSMFPLMQKGQFWLNRGTAIAIAFGAAIGIHFTFAYGNTGWDAHLWGPQLTLASFIIDVLRQFAAQEFFFDSKFNKVDNV